MFADIKDGNGRSLPATVYPYDPEWGLPLTTPLPPTALQSSFLCIPTMVTLISTLLNGYVLFTVLRNRAKRFQVAYYVIICAFMSSMVVSGIINMVFTVVTEMLHKEYSFFDVIYSINDLFIALYSAILLFIISFNRLCVFTLTTWDNILFSVKRACFILIGTCAACLGTAIGVYIASNIRCYQDENGMYQYYADNMQVVSITMIVAYVIPLVSSVFYARVFYFLRSKRTLAVHSNTRQLLDRAERCTLKQGLYVLIVYLAALIIHIVLGRLNNMTHLADVLHTVEKVLNTIPQIAIPLSLLMCCPEVRKACKFRKSSQSGSMGVTKIRISSAHEEKPKITHTTTAAMSTTVAFK